MTDTPHSREALETASYRGGAATVARFLDAGIATGDNALCLALLHERRSVVETLLARGAISDWCGSGFRDGTETPLMIAVESGRADLVAMILALRPDTNAADHEGKTALFRARMGREFEAISDLLLDAGADPSRPTKFGSTALHVICDAEFTRRAVARGAFVDARDAQGATPLISACSEEKALVLIEARADPTVRDDSGRSFEDVARSRRWTRALRALETR